MKVLSSEEFVSQVTGGKGIAVIDFYADRCGPCKMLGMFFPQIEEKFKDKVLIAKLDVDISGDIAGEFDISSIPCVVFFKDGKEVDRIIGLSEMDVYVSKIESLLA